ncbi:MAG: NYN domain-containing protein [Candidatus Microthrix sp.]|nr:NYN domain-containing protein [Candidatus Microthrix sp.]
MTIIMNPDSPTAVFWDLENIYWLLHQQERGQPKETLLQIMRDMRQSLESQLTGPWIMQTAYADFEALPEPMQGDLSLMGVGAVNVLKTRQKNSTDMRLAIDALVTLYERPWIRTHVIVSGDRDFIPLVDHLRRAGIDVRVASFPETLAGDLRTVVGADHLIDAADYLPKGEAQGSPSPSQLHCPAYAKQVGTLTQAARALLVYTLDEYVFARNLSEVHLGPLKRSFSERYPSHGSTEVSRAVTELLRKRVFRLEKREGVDLRTGDSLEYSVVLPEWDNPFVTEANESFGTRGKELLDAVVDSHVDRSPHP